MTSTGQSQALKKRDAPVIREGGDQLTLTPLGAGNEVGRSCVYMSFKDCIGMTSTFFVVELCQW
ncbi:hypothetical protein OIU79_009104 [Salix purpurea]|uniref:Uncharacterized protein n=1 Tax=Salix purpurea TaxID=77065 RepID=A0A9Q0TJZ9_SALPP|nr:hypothetical protein OIU79_009104 [Salix purpurea]